MTVEEAIYILDPKTTSETIRTMREKGMSESMIIDKVNEACVIACEIMKKSINRKYEH